VGAGEAGLWQQWRAEAWPGRVGAFADWALPCRPSRRRAV